MERSRLVSGMLLAVVLIILVAPYTQRDVFVKANPIMPPPLAMEFEFINTTISFADGGLLAKVNASYYLENRGPAARIDYPLPPNAQRVSVAIDNRSWLWMPWLTNETPETLEWTYNSKIYSTALGDWPMINFTINHAGNYSFFGPDEPYCFGLEVYYEHFLPLAGGNYTYLYALGSSRYAPGGGSSWPRYAFVTIRMLMNYTDLNVYSVGYSNESWTWTPATRTVDQQDSLAGERWWDHTFTPWDYTFNNETMLDTIKCGWIYGDEYMFTRDFAVTFSNPRARHPFDLNGDLKIDIKDLATAAKAFGSYPGHPNWELIADLNLDGQVDIRDLVLIVKNFGKTYP